jgi:hypothetical protein
MRERLTILADALGALFVLAAMYIIIKVIGEYL